MADNINISPEMIDNLMNILKNNNSDTNHKNSDTNSNKETNPFENVDIETIIKFKNIMDSLNNRNDPDSNLLYSLKPYLRKSRQDKLDQYINILKISQLSKLFKNEKGDIK